VAGWHGQAMLGLATVGQGLSWPVWTGWLWLGLDGLGVAGMDG